MPSAVIDIGYNAIRAVVYEEDTLGAPEIFNEKFRNDVLHLLQHDDLDIKHQTYLLLKYLVHIFDKLSVNSIICVATAVLRGHPRAKEFTIIVKQKFGIHIDIISGEREAYLTAAGLISGIAGASGIIADLGGGSLELACVSDNEIGSLKSLPLGTKIIAENNLGNLEAICNILQTGFDQCTYNNLYLIGGALRFIGRYYMDFVHYPLKNLHNLEISNVDFTTYLETLDNIYKTKMQHEYRKIDYNAILVAKAMLTVFSPQKVVISNYGLKEGVRFLSLPEEEHKKDIVYERIKALVKIDSKVCILDDYSRVINDLLIKPDDVTLNIVHLSIMLAQFNKNIDKTLRANFAVEFILSSDIPFSHRQRLMLGLILTYTYNTKIDSYINKLTKKMLCKIDLCNSQIIGNFIKIARQIDGPEFESPSFNLTINNGYIEIDTASILPRSIFEKVCERLKDISYARKISKNRY
ncbi:MAG: Ppx/GppA family phosphatase [Rickettsiaceae bacterium]|nr:MAG: Ppx/GppA family phosphatase [Rickettsiaceae bacterium]